MRRVAKGSVLLAIPLATFLAFSARAQDFSDVQSMVSRTLFRQRVASDERQEAGRRRIEVIDQRAQQQALALEEHAQSVQQLRRDLQYLRDERELVGLADAFDAAIASGRWPLARSLLADTVTLDLARRSDERAKSLAADRFIENLAARPPRVLPRSNQRVRVEGDRALLIANSYDWGSADAGGREGEFEYRFVRTADDWKIEGLRFRPR